MGSATIDQIALELTANATKADRVIKDLIKSTEDLKRAFQSLSTASDSTNRSLSSLGRLNREATQAAQAQERLRQSTANTEAAQARAAAAQERLRQATINTATAQERLNATAARASTAQERLTQATINTETAQTRSATAQERLRAATASAETAQTRSATAQERLQQATLATATAQERLEQATANTEAAQARAAAAQERLTQAQMRTAQLTERQASNYQGLGAVLGGIKWAAIAGGFRMLGNTIGSFVTRSNEYVENLNLFAAQMGEFRGQADAFISQLETMLGVDPSEAMQYLGFFMQLTQSMGVASDKAYIMSKNLTQLGYDISSFVNIGIEDAMLKLQSGLAGKRFARPHSDVRKEHHCTVKAIAA